MPAGECTNTAMTTMAATMMAKIRPVRLVSRPATRRPGWTRNRIRSSAWTSTGVADGASVAAAAPGRPSAESLEKNWDAVVEAVRQESRVAWMLLHNASVLSVEDGVLTLRFAREGEMKGFSVSGHDAVLKRVLSADFGLDVTVRGVTGADAGDRQARSPAGPGPGPAPEVPPRSRPRPGQPSAAQIPPDEPDDAPPDEPDVDSAPRESELTGMDLIQRELGGQVIGEIED